MFFARSIKTKALKLTGLDESDVFRAPAADDFFFEASVAAVVEDDSDFSFTL
jgi:hypothetical protein